MRKLANTLPIEMEHLENKETVSVIIPAYNAEAFITEAIKSCAAQTYRPIEVVVVNDGSTDATPTIVKKIGNTLRSKIELNLTDVNPNQGAANALRIGFSNAKGKFVCWLSADDLFIDKEKVARQVQCMERTDAAWSYYRYFYAGSNLSNARLLKPSYLPWLGLLDPIFVRDADLRLMLLLFKSPINGSSIMIRKECIEKYGTFDPVTRNVDGDGDLWMRYSSLGLKVVALNGAPVFYREHPMQTSKKQLVMLYGCDLTRLRMLSFLERGGRLVGLIKKFALFFPLVVETNYHKARPFVSEFLFKYIIDHKKELGKILSIYAQKALKDVETEIDQFGLDRKKCAHEAEIFKHSSAFKSFEHVSFEKRLR